MKTTLGALVASVLLTSACSVSDQVPNAFSEHTPTGTEDSTPAHEASRNAETNRSKQVLFRTPTPLAYDVLSYDLALSPVDWTKPELEASVTLQVERLDPANRVLELDSRVRVDSVRLAGSDTLLPFDQAAATGEKPKLKITLPEGSALNEIVISYFAPIDALADGRPAGLVRVPPRKGDPVQAKVIYTTAEPLSAAEWMPCHNDPRDRARFSVTAQTAGPTEIAIANGVLVPERSAPEKGLFTYSLREPIPTYLMAFAIGEFEASRGMAGPTPITVWRRKDHPADGAALVSVIARQIKHFEKLVGPYPFQSYSLVLLPEFSAEGLEHASVTFQSETGSTLTDAYEDVNLTAHELAHQWFGDYVTIESWDDLWIKEGMATLLAEEGAYAVSANPAPTPYFRQHFHPKADEAIRDEALAPDDKYTSGPYDRAAWLLTQIRSVVGEKVFWGTWRKILRDRALSFVGTEDLLKAFGPTVGPEKLEKIKSALVAKQLPKLSLSPLKLQDPEGAMVEDFTVFRLDTGSVGARFRLGEDESIANDMKGKFAAISMWILDPENVHPLRSLLDRNTASSAPGSWTAFTPKTESQRKFFHHQTPEAAGFLYSVGLPVRAQIVNGSGYLLATYRDLATTNARLHYLNAMCRGYLSTANEDDRHLFLAHVLEPVLNNAALAPVWALETRRIKTGYAACEALDVETLFQSQFDQLKKDPAGLGAERLARTLANVPLRGAPSLQFWPRIFEHPAAPPRVRQFALLAALRAQDPESKFFTPATPSSPLAFLLDRAKDSFSGGFAVGDVISTLVDGLALSKDSKSYPQYLWEKLRHLPWRTSAKRALACGLYDAEKTAGGASSNLWKRFVASQQPLAELPQHLREALESPEINCN